ncbi:hypothetical protein DTO96_101802 [Ephemeroptericola cinctiostellae]|uniref:DUF4145 domain-containing protein n=1 Tax=Ephemeroptericola cinctiostellae TaxID=2268024 RepID=A0A345DCH3_9BURK|nr:hypothetical protein [Ephemeroptericola cinctiostellae]AXF86061.1 hypothetical protein DTO96_101802 [Ephemeroptericola cinctiostellae]
MSLPQIFQWVVSAHLDDHKSPELVLLKGHLLLEVAIDNAAQQFLAKEKHENLTEFSFHKKLQTLSSLQTQSPANMAKAIEHLHALNRIRNRLAHEFQFAGGEDSLAQWSQAVLSDFSGVKFQRHTFRTKLIHAIGALASVVVNPKSDLSIESAGSNPSFNGTPGGAR